MGGWGARGPPGHIYVYGPNVFMHNVRAGGRRKREGTARQFQDLLLDEGEGRKFETGPAQASAKLAFESLGALSAWEKAG